jgi:hypothetical protein
MPAAGADKKEDMTVDLNAEQDREWKLLYHQIKKVLQQVGEEWVSRQCRGDYLLVDDNMGWYQHKIELQNLNLLKPAVIKSLQRLVATYPNWEIVIAVDIPGKENDWPSMGLVIRDDEIVDGLKREYFPSEFQNIRYERRRPIGSRFSDVMYSERTRTF